MPNFFTPEHEAFRKSVRTWVERELTPHALEWDRAGIFPREVFSMAGELGFLGINHDPKYGGSGLDYWYVTAFCEELVRSHNAGVNMALMVQSQMATPIIIPVKTDISDFKGLPSPGNPAGVKSGESGFQGATQADIDAEIRAVRDGK